MASDSANLFRELKRNGWRLENYGSKIKAHHPDGGFVIVSRIFKGRIFENALSDIRRLEKYNDEEKRKKIFALNAGRNAQPDKIKKPEPKKEGKPKMLDAQKKDDAILDLISTEMGDGHAKILAAIQALDRRIDSIGVYLKTEAERKSDEEGFAKRMKFLDGNLSLLGLDTAKIIPFENEKELVEHTKVIHAYGQKNGKQFQTMRHELKLTVVRVK